MALIQCPSCSAPVSEQAQQCPWCGSWLNPVQQSSQGFVSPSQKPVQQQGMVATAPLQLGYQAASRPSGAIRRLTTNRGFWQALILIIVTLGFYMPYLIHAYAKETNIACTKDGNKTPGLFVYILLQLVTFGIYGIVWHCMWISRCNKYLLMNHKTEGLQVSTYLLTLFLFGWMTLGIMYIVVGCKTLYLQNKVNMTYNEINNLL